jgi:hypothetical protein
MNGKRNEGYTNAITFAFARTSAPSSFKRHGVLWELSTEEEACDRAMQAKKALFSAQASRLQPC